MAVHADPEWGKWSDERCIMATPFACKTRGKSSAEYKELRKRRCYPNQMRM